jgi:magnesium chelatase family protein
MCGGGGVLSRIFTSSVLGIEGLLVEVEVDVTSGLPHFAIVGLPSEEVRESRDRVRVALKNSGYRFPPDRIVVNLAPASVRKTGASFDLPIAVGIAAASGQIEPAAAKTYLVLGELSLDGRLKRTRGVLCMVSVAEAQALSAVLLPASNANEAVVATAKPVYGARTLAEVLEIIDGKRMIHPVARGRITDDRTRPDLDFSEVRGQEHAKRAVEVAAAGAHNILFSGPPGSGKTMIARRIPTILPEMTMEEALETTKIFSVAGLLKQDGLMSARPFRSPHHTVSDVALIGGGTIPRPGEVSLANHGVLFLDEFTEFKRSALEVLRQPLEDQVVTITRARATATFPAAFMLVAAMNPCPCGNLTDPGKPCRCSVRDIERYRRKISGPLLDRIDIHIDVPPARYTEISGTSHGEDSVTIRQRVARAREVQATRLSGEARVFANSQMSPRLIREVCSIDGDGRDLLRSACLKLGLSARSYTKVLKVSRTIADLDGTRTIEPRHLAEAIQYRSYDSM